MKLFKLLIIILLPPLIVYAQSPSGTLPVLQLHTNNGLPIESKTDYVYGSCEVEWTDGSIDSIGRMQIKGHGNYTWKYFDKKPYHLKLVDYQPILGMSPGTHFILLPHADDWLGYLRNTGGFELSRRIGLPYTPQQVAVELMLNEEYLGLYFVTEQIRVDENRVNIIEQLSDDNTHDPSMGGWLLEVDNYRGENQLVLGIDSVKKMLITVHSPKSLSAKQREWITSRLSHIDTLIRRSEADEDTWTEWVDIEALARFYIVQELVDNIEGFHGSCFMTIHGGEDNKLKFGPVWDFGNSFARGYAPEPHFITEENEGFNKFWIEALVRHPHFMDHVRKTWTAFRERDDTDLEEFIDNFTAHIAGAIDANHDRWPNYDTDNMEIRWLTYKQFLTRRIEFLDRNWSLSSIEAITPIPYQLAIKGNQIIVNDAGYHTDHISLKAYSIDGRTITLERISPSTWQIDHKGIVILQLTTPTATTTHKALPK